MDKFKISGSDDNMENSNLIIIFSLICMIKNAEMQTLYNFSGALLPIFIGNNCQ